MARPREFDQQQVLNAAIECFWARGYEATSVRDLADSMGITGASLYNAFGTKRGLYLRALDHYVERGFAERAARLESTQPPRQAIERFLTEIIDRSLADKQCKGCMIVNSAMELPPHDAEFASVLADILKRMEGFFRRCVERGQQDGTVNPALHPDELAATLLSVLMGTRVLARSRPEPALLRGLLRPVLALLDSGVSTSGQPSKQKKQKDTA